MNDCGRMRLRLNAIDVDCVIGDLPDERERLQRLAVDLDLEIDAAAAESDELSDTVDYAALTEAVRAALVAARCRMIERAAKVAADVACEFGSVRSAEATVTKKGSVPHLGSASATYRRTR